MNPCWRSLLFVPADDQARLVKVAQRGADAIILDLEDAVPLARKAAARRDLPAVVGTLAGQGCSVVVRINSSWRLATAELAVVVQPGIAAVMVPKVEGAPRLAVLAEMIAEAAEDAGLAVPPGIIALVESPAGIAELDRIAAIPEVIGLALGTEDFSLALGVPPTREALELPCRMIAMASARYGLMALGLPVSIATIDDDESWCGGVRSARAMGMTGALCIHPRQIGPANEGFAPTAAEIDAARRVLETWKHAGGAGAIQLDGKMIDRPVVLAAERVMSRIKQEG